MLNILGFAETMILTWLKIYQSKKSIIF